MNPDLARLIDEVLEFHWSSSPTSATAAGIHAHDDRLADCDGEAIEAKERDLSAYCRSLARLAASLPSLTPDEALDVAVLENALPEPSVEFLKQGLHGLALWWLDHRKERKKELIDAAMEVAWKGLRGRREP